MKQIRTLEELCLAALDRKAVTTPSLRIFQKPTSAAFVQNLPGVRILPLLNAGLFIYEKKTKPTQHEKDFIF